MLKNFENFNLDKDILSDIFSEMDLEISTIQKISILNKDVFKVSIIIEENVEIKKFLHSLNQIIIKSMNFEFNPIKFIENKYWCIIETQIKNPTHDIDDFDMENIGEIYNMFNKKFNISNFDIFENFNGWFLQIQPENGWDGKFDDLFKLDMVSIYLRKST
jgi:hypothetical protein